MLGFDFNEIIVIVVLAIVVVGPDRLPEMMRFLGKQYGKVMKASNELRRAFMMEAERADAEQRAEENRARREAARRRAARARARSLAKKAGEAVEPVPRSVGLEEPPPTPAALAALAAAIGQSPEELGVEPVAEAPPPMAPPPKAEEPPAASPEESP